MKKFSPLSRLEKTCHILCFLPIDGEIGFYFKFLIVQAFQCNIFYSKRERGKNSFQILNFWEKDEFPNFLKYVIVSSSLSIELLEYRKF